MFVNKYALSNKRHKCNVNVIRRNHNQLHTLRLSYQKTALYRLAVNPTFSAAITAKMASTWSMGPGTLEIPLSLFAKNRDRLAEKLKSGQVVVLQGGDSISHYDTDVEYVFRQASSKKYYDHTSLIVRTNFKVMT